MLRIGIDFDNTIADYDTVFAAVACEAGWLKPGTGGTKREVRDAIRKLDEGEVKWQRLQAEVYGPRMGEAALVQGVDRFLTACADSGATVYIISHKTEFANYDTTGTNLRNAARDWLRARRSENPLGFGVAEEHVFFESTRAEKIQRIAELGCTYFIDDLEEVLLDNSFPQDVAAIHLRREQAPPTDTSLRSFANWDAITEAVFNG